MAFGTEERPSKSSYRAQEARPHDDDPNELPESTARAARKAGLLTPEALSRLLTDALRRRQAADALLSMADRVAAAGIGPMPMDEINAEVKAARAERRQRASGH